MILLGLSICAALVGLLACARALSVPRARLSDFERKRRAKEGDTAAIQEQQHELYTSEMQVVIWLIQMILVVALVWTIWTLVGGIIAIVVIITTIWLSGVMARAIATSRLGIRLGRKITDRLIVSLSRYSALRILLRGPQNPTRHSHAPASRQELASYISHTGSILRPDEKQLLLAGLEFDTMRAIDIMVPRQKLTTIPSDELLGPLVINELHQARQQWFPVVAGETIVGMIDLDQLTAVSGEVQTRKAETIMQRELERIEDSASLRTALNVCLAQHRSVLLVTRPGGETIGLVLLEDIIAAVFGEHLKA